LPSAPGSQSILGEKPSLWNPNDRNSPAERRLPGWTAAATRWKTHPADSLLREGQVHDQPQAFGEESATGIRVVGVVTHRGGLESAPHDVGDIDLADDVVVALRSERVDDERASITRLDCKRSPEIFGIDRVPP